jgi:hypothetical protein
MWLKSGMDVDGCTSSEQIGARRRMDVAHKWTVIHPNREMEETKQK